MKLKELLTKEINFSYKFSWAESSLVHKLFFLAAIAFIAKGIF